MRSTSTSLYSNCIVLRDTHLHIPLSHSLLSESMKYQKQKHSVYYVIIMPTERKKVCTFIEPRLLLSSSHLRYQQGIQNFPHETAHYTAHDFILNILSRARLQQNFDFSCLPSRLGFDYYNVLMWRPTAKNNTRGAEPEQLYLVVYYYYYSGATTTTATKTTV